MLFWDNTQDEILKNNILSGDIVPAKAGLTWAENSRGTTLRVRYKTDNKGRTSAQDSYYYGEGKAIYLGSPKLISKDSLKNQIFVSWWYKPGKSPADEGGSNKFIRIWDQGSGYGTRISWTQMHLTCGDDVHWGNWNGNIGEWNHHMVYVDLVAQKVQTWVNGTLLHDAKCIKSTTYPDNLLYVGLIGFDHGSESYNTMTTSFDDVYVGASLARVEISNAPTWSAVMRKEIMPVDTWNSTQIKLKPNKGYVDFNSDVYVYIYDKNGVSNKAGFLVKCTACPKPPKPL
jgi:hypothetical protein